MVAGRSAGLTAGAGFGLLVGAARADEGAWLGLADVGGVAAGAVGGWARVALGGIVAEALREPGSEESTRNCSLSLPAMACFMKVIHIGSAAFAPVSFSPRDSRLS